MNICKLFLQNRAELVCLFRYAIIHGLIDTWNRCNRLKSKPQEPDFVAGLVLESTPGIHFALKAILAPNNISVSMHAVFCHQKPLVSFNALSRASCELGDILFVYVHYPRSRSPRRNAVLFQAKVSNILPYSIHNNEKDQLYLYANWPDFTYTRSSLLSGKSRSVRPKAPHAGAQYLLIDSSPQMHLKVDY